ncbi:hypothetical protein GUJ93_ZPchr0008g14105 [Zizania palustris]|uniref:Uncharacterized protein n=1 Tax=Zizania palustris TaxID=103762 RepID=A0A8J5R487_ZIZPA|nr:hypothetical protein GUJ93_ZPchr0008g14105 [Zizania palustris]
MPFPKIWDDSIQKIEPSESDNIGSSKCNREERRHGRAAVWWSDNAGELRGKRAIGSSKGLATVAWWM